MNHEARFSPPAHRIAHRVTLLSMVILASWMTAAHAADHPSFASHENAEQLAQGRAIWLENCEGCHAWGIADAPIPSEPAAWAERLKQPMATLYDHAINGFFGPDDSMMPARGGNDALSDAQVKAAVDYMTEYARLHQPN